jgi:hypothetical protein
VKKYFKFLCPKKCTRIHILRFILRGSGWTKEKIQQGWLAVLMLMAVGFSQGGIINPAMDGTFIQIDGSVSQRTLAQWGKEFALMRTIGMHTVITGAARWNDTVYYPSSAAGVTQVGNQPIEKILTVADTTGMDVYLGVYMDDDWWSNEGNASVMDDMASKSTTVAAELWSLYSTHPSLKGWYLTPEIDNWTTREETNRKTMVSHFLQPVSDYCHKISGLPVSIAPFFNSSLPMTATDWEGWWVKTLNEATSVNLIIMQDGMGTHSGNLSTTIPAYFGAVGRACDSTGRTLWSDMEIFDQVSTSPFYAIPATLSRITAQIQYERTIVPGLVCWEYYYYMSPNRGVNEGTLYSQYSAYLYGAPYSVKTNLALNCAYTLQPAPSSSYPDTGMAELTDGIIAGYNWTSQVGWSNPASHPLLTVDLGASKSGLVEFWASFLQDTGSGVYLPEGVEVLISANGTDFTSVGTMTAPAILNNQASNVYVLSGVTTSGRYIRFDVTPHAGTWLMCNELQAYQQESQTSVECWEFVTE